MQDPTRSGNASLRIRTARIASGLLLLVFVTSHLSNLGFGLISVSAMEAARPYLSGIWGGPLLGSLLLLALIVHFSLGLWAIYRRPVLRTNTQDMVQLLSGVLIVPLLATHAIGISMVNGAGVDFGYASAIELFWLSNPLIGLLQVTVLSVVWVHGCAGLFTWMRSRPRSSAVLTWLYPLAVAIPIVALLGYAEAGKEVLAAAANGQIAQFLAQSAPLSTAIATTPPPEVPFALIKRITSAVIWGSVILAGLTFAARALRLWRHPFTAVSIVRNSAAPLASTSGLSLLDGFRLNDQPHASLCEGRGRCGTCAVRVLSSEFPLPDPGPLELQTLHRINAGNTVRLACQLVPSGGRVVVDPIYPADYSFQNDRALPPMAEVAE